MRDGQKLAKFYVDNRQNYPQRWVLTLDSREPKGYAQLIKWWKGRTEFLVYVWGEPIELTDAQKGVLSYWKVCFNAQPLFD